MGAVRRSVGVAVVAFLAAGTAARAGTMLWVVGDPFGGTGSEFLGSPGSAFVASAQSYSSGVSLRVTGPASAWRLTFGTAAGAFEPGQYLVPPVNPVPGAYLMVERDGTYCNTPSGSFVVHEVTFAPGGTVATFAADFEEYCDGAVAGGVVRGAVRYHAGDAACAGAPDGTRCNDADACSAGDHCVAGACVPSTGPPCAGPRDRCAPPACDPRDGQCVEPTATEPPPCDDGDPCTDDFCAAAGGCEHVAVACFDLRGRATATAYAAGQQATRSARTGGVLVLRDDGTYTAPASTAVCQPTPDEVGTVRPGRRHRLILEPDNADEIAATLATCLGYHLRVHRYRAWIHISDDGQTLRGRTHATATVRVRGIPVSVRAMARFRGTRRPAPP